MGQAVSTSQVVDDVVARTGLNKTQAKQAVSAVVEALGERLARGERIQIGGLGTFEVRDRAARTATNPRTREQIHVPASKGVGFRAAAVLRGRLGSHQD